MKKRFPGGAICKFLKCSGIINLRYHGKKFSVGFTEMRNAKCGENDWCVGQRSGKVGGGGGYMRHLLEVRSDILSGFIQNLHYNKSHSLGDQFLAFSKTSLLCSVEKIVRQSKRITVKVSRLSVIFVFTDLV